MSTRPFAAAALLLALAGPAAAQDENRPRGGKSDLGTARLLAPFQPVVARANESTVRVLANGKDAALGTVVFADGYVLTKASELRGAVSVRFADGSAVPAKLVGAHEPTDLALLKVDKKGLVPLTFADSKVAALGNWLAAAGVGSDPTAVGIVSVVTRSFGEKERQMEKLRGSHLNANRGWLGISMGESDGKEKGAVVGTVAKGAAGAKAGLRPGDVIYEVNGQAIETPDAMIKLLNDFRPGQRVTLGVRRKDEELQLTATLSARPSEFQDRSDIQNGMGGQLSGRRGGFERVLQTDMVVDPENCGGAVVDLDGRAIGVCISRAGRVETYVLPGEVIRPLLSELRDGKYAPAAPTRTSVAPPSDDPKPTPRRPATGGDPSQANP